jgi:DNA-binding response OmpR family regulator
MGDIRTYYASNMSFALSTYSEKHLDLVFCELTFPGGSAEEFIRQIGGLDATDDLFFVVTTSQNLSHAKALASELGIDSVLPSPFSTNDIVDRVNKALEKKQRDRNLWINSLLEAKLAAKTMRTQEARTQFKELVKNHPQNEDVLLEAARFFLQIPDFDSSSQLIAQAVALNPQSIKARAIFGTLSIRKGDYDDGRKILESVHLESPLSSSRTLEIGTAYNLLSLRQARHALDINDGSIPAILMLIKGLTILGKYTEVVSSYEKYKDRLFGEEKREIEYFVAISKKLGNLT